MLAKYRVLPTAVAGGTSAWHRRAPTHLHLIAVQLINAHAAVPALLPQPPATREVNKAGQAGGCAERWLGAGQRAPAAHAAATHSLPDCSSPTPASPVHPGHHVGVVVQKVGHPPVGHQRLAFVLPCGGARAHTGGGAGEVWAGEAGLCSGTAESRPHSATHTAGPSCGQRPRLN